MKNNDSKKITQPGATKRRKSEFARASWGDKIFMIVVVLLVLLVTFVCIYPMWYTIMASLSSSEAIGTGKVSFWPVDFTVDAYKFVIEYKAIWKGYYNSIIYTVLGTMFNVALTIPAAYVLSKAKMPGHKLFTTIFLIAMYFSGGLIPKYMLFNALGLTNTRFVLAIIDGIYIYNTIIARTYFVNNIPESLYEAAKIDGANDFLIFFKIVLQLSKPIIAVIALYYAVSHWSDYFNAMVFVTNSEYYPLQVVLQQILIYNKKAYDIYAQDATDGAFLADLEYRAKMATVMKYSVVFIASAPMLIIYPFIQKYFVKGMMIGSVKG